VSELRVESEHQNICVRFPGCYELYPVGYMCVRGDSRRV
jgi:hypothetical protein